MFKKVVFISTLATVAGCSFKGAESNVEVARRVSLALDCQDYSQDKNGNINGLNYVSVLLISENEVEIETLKTDSSGNAKRQTVVADLFKANVLNDGTIKQEIQYRFQFKKGSLVVTWQPALNSHSTDRYSVQVDGNEKLECTRSSSRIDQGILTKMVNLSRGK